MRSITLLLLLAFSVLETYAQQHNRTQLRNLFLSATERKTALDSFMLVLERLSSKTPAEESYYGICNGLYCQYDNSNWAKLRHVMKSRNHLNSAIERDAHDPELRFMRFMLEHFLPSFLGLNKHIPDDLAVIFKNPKFIDENLLLKRKVVEFLLWTKRCSTEQNAQLQAELAKLNKATAAAK